MQKKEKLDIVYEDKELIIINKPAGLLTVSTEKEKEKTLYHRVSEYLKKKNKNNKVFVVHRLDKDTSGIIIFAKNEKIKQILQNSWDDIIKLRQYVAIVEGEVIEKKKTIKSWLKETSTLMTYSSNKPNDGKLAITKYRCVLSNKNNSLLEIEILTGRKNQIRVQLNDIGYPIIGDKKYGSKTNPIKRLGLHANKLIFIHPSTKKELILEVDLPNEFVNIFNARA